MKSAILLLLTLILASQAFAQDSTSVDHSQRIFMPSIQMGYVNNHADELSGGLFIQTSLEYQTPKGIFFRVNYDDYDTSYKLQNPQNELGTLNGKVSFSEFIGGIGIRKVMNKHNLLVLVQSGYRFFDTPLIVEEGNNISVVLESGNANMNRYTIGYEYEVTPKTFIILEIFGSHVWEAQDYWENNQWATGITLGVTATLF